MSCKKHCIVVALIDKSKMIGLDKSEMKSKVFERYIIIFGDIPEIMRMHMDDDDMDYGALYMMALGYELGAIIQRKYYLSWNPDKTTLGYLEHNGIIVRKSVVHFDKLPDEHIMASVLSNMIDSIMNPAVDSFTGKEFSGYTIDIDINKD